MQRASTKAIVFHQFRQIFLYTSYFAGFQLIAFHYGLRANWTFLAFVVLLITSVYEDTRFFNQDSIPEPVLLLRVWSNNIPLITSQTLIYVLERGHFISPQILPGPKEVGRPEQMIIKISSTGFELLDDIFLAAAYYLFYFNNFCIFRSLAAQLRLVGRVLRENLNWSEEPRFRLPGQNQENEPFHLPQQVEGIPDNSLNSRT